MVKGVQTLRWTIYYWVEYGRLKGIKVGNGTLRIFKDSLDRLIEENIIDENIIDENIK